MASAPHAELRRVTRREHDDGLRCQVRRGLCWTWDCSCEAPSPLYRTRAEALAGKREHEAEHAR